jgi:hypothetical protein
MKIQASVPVLHLAYKTTVRELAPKVANRRLLSVLLLNSLYRCSRDYVLLTIMLLRTIVSYAWLMRLAACQFPGPQQIQTNQNGVEVWRAQRFPDDEDVIEYTGRSIHSPTFLCSISVS